VHPGVIARQIRQRHGDVPYAFYGEAENLALCFHMRAVIPNLLGADAVARAAAAQPGLVLIEATSTKASPAPAPDGYTRAESLTEGSRTFVVYEPTERPPPSPL
jgi:hypothetical protein